MKIFVYDFILELSLVLSLAVIIYLLARALPRISETAFTEEERPLSALDKAVNRIPLSRLDHAIHSFFVKFLRKSRIVIMKVDNRINEYLKRMKEQQNSASGEKIREKLEQMNATKEEGGEKKEE